MNIAGLFDQMGWQNPKQYNMSGAQFAAFLLCNPKQRFFVDIHMQWEWYPYSSAATYPFDVKLGCIQGHSNHVVDPYSTHHPLTYDEAMCLGWIFHVTDSANVPSIQQYGLKTDVKGSGQGGRDPVHFMYHNDNGQGYIRMAEGTHPPRYYRQPVYFMLDSEFIESQQLFLTKNGVVLCHGDIPAEFLGLQDQLPTLACNVLRPGRTHAAALLMLVMDMFDVRRVSVLVQEVPFLKISEQQHGSSWVRRFPQTMGSLFFAFP